MATYIYSRETLASGDTVNEWDIDNPNRVNGSDEQIYLADEIAAAIPTKTLGTIAVSCDSSVCTINFTEALTTEEETTLTNTVNNHKNNT